MSKVNDQSAEDAYGEAFGVSDVLACYIDFSDEEGLVRFSFAKNGQDLGQAFEFDRRTLPENTDDAARLTFYPHLLVKNVKFECNFGQLVSVTICLHSHRIPLDLISTRKLPGQKSKLSIHSLNRSR